MKSLKFLVLAAGLAFTTTTIAETYQIDTSKSTLEWHGSKIVGSKHNGNVKIKSGVVEFSATGPQSAEVVIDMTTITDNDLEGEWNKKLVTHLSSDDFFNVEKFPTAKIVAKSFKAVGDGKFEVTGELTIRDVTKPITFVSMAKGHSITADIKFDRTTWNVRYGSGKFFKNLGDKMISDEVQVKVALVTKKALKLGQK
jgi:polyisoprenoid-binding protein YceI